MRSVRYVFKPQFSKAISFKSKPLTCIGQIFTSLKFPGHVDLTICPIKHIFKPFFLKSFLAGLNVLNRKYQTNKSVSLKIVLL